MTSSRVRLCPKRLGDAVRDYAWRTDPELTSLDASAPLNMKFNQYLAKYAGELGRNSPNGRKFAIDTLDGEHIGNCAYHSVNSGSGEAEIGVMIGNRSYWNRGYGADAVTALVNYLFNDTKIERVFLKTLYSNKRAQRCFARCGFTLCGELVKGGHSFVLMELYRCQWRQNGDKYRLGESGYEKEYCKQR